MENESRILLGLMARGAPPHIAQGIVANMIAESRLDPGINEIAPLVKGSRGGFGLNQWTGPRRRALEAAAKARGVSVDDLDFQLDYTMEELRGPESKAMAALQGARTAEEAARIYSERFLRPGIPHLDKRLGHARRLAGQGVPEKGNALEADTARVAGMTAAPGAEDAARQRNALAMLERARVAPLEVNALSAPQLSAAPMPPMPFDVDARYQPRSVRRT
jgi:hypothetical protein